MYFYESLYIAFRYSLKMAEHTEVEDGAVAEIFNCNKQLC
jgi:hypothetical protein